MTTLSRGARVQADIAALLCSRHSLLWVVTREEARVERALTEAAATLADVSELNEEEVH
jgi:hypothetical protein